MRQIRWTLVLLVLVGTQANAGVFFHRKEKDQVPGGTPPNLVTPNGVEVPRWASKRMRESPVPLYGQSWGRRPWAYPLSTQATASAYMARLDQLGVGAGPVPGYTNGPIGSGNVPIAPMGTTGLLPYFGRRTNPSTAPFVPYSAVNN